MTPAPTTETDLYTLQSFLATRLTRESLADAKPGSFILDTSIKEIGIDVRELPLKLGSEAKPDQNLIVSILEEALVPFGCFFSVTKSVEASNLRVYFIEKNETSSEEGAERTVQLAQCFITLQSGGALLTISPLDRKYGTLTRE